MNTQEPPCSRLQPLNVIILERCSLCSAVVRPGLWCEQVFTAWGGTLRAVPAWRLGSCKQSPRSQLAFLSVSPAPEPPPGSPQAPADLPTDGQESAHRVQANPPCVRTPGKSVAMRGANCASRSGGRRWAASCQGLGSGMSAPCGPCPLVSVLQCAITARTRGQSRRVGPPIQLCHKVHLAAAAGLTCKHRCPLLPAGSSARVTQPPR